MSQYTLDAQKFPLHDAAVKSALAEYNKKIIEIPPGSHSNTSPEIRKYQAATFLKGTGWAWCVAFFQYNWLIAEPGKHGLPYKGAGAYDMLAWAKKANWTTKTPIPGDGVCWNMGSGHWSMFLRREGTYIVTVDGNVSDAVLICKRPASLVAGYMHVPELAQKKIAPVTPKLMKPKKYQIVTSINGSKQIVVSGRTLPNLIPFITKSVKNHKAITIEEIPVAKPTPPKTTT